MQVYSNLKNYSLHPKEKSVDRLPFEWHQLSTIPTEAIKHKYIAVLVYAYIHSGIALSLSDFQDPWDSGIAGVLLFKCNEKNITKKAESFVKQYNDQENGDEY